MNIRSKKILNNDNEFFTDSNGLYMMRRVKDHREAFESKNFVPVAANYYPITSSLYINDQDKKNRLTVVTERQQGCTVYKPGEIEIMLHGVTVQDDWKGLGELLQDQEDNNGGPLKVLTRHFVMYSSSDNSVPSQQRTKQYQLDRPLHIWFADSKVDEFLKANQNDKQITLDLPDNVKLWVRSYNVNEYVVRLHNLDDNTAKMVDIWDRSNQACTLLNKLSGRTDLKATKITELALFTHKDQSQIHKNKMDKNAKEVTHNDHEGLTAIELLPMEIRTFNIVLLSS